MKISDKFYIHFIGIGGIGMSGIASILNNDGHTVSGSDLSSNDITEDLEKRGVKIYMGHSEENMTTKLHCVVKSSAIKDNNPEIQFAKKHKIPVLQRAEMLAEISNIKTGIAVAGTHGKTTTSSILAKILHDADLDPTFVIGGQVYEFAQNARQGHGELFVFEADESDGSFLKYSPSYSLVTNIDCDHMSFYKTEENLLKTFLEFINNVHFYGFVVLNIDDQRIQKIIPDIEKKYISVSLEGKADYRAKVISANTFEVFKKEESLGEFMFSLPGRHNIYNSLCAIAFSSEVGISLESVRKSLSVFKGVKRRFDILKEESEFVVVDDYAHHPTEINAVITAAREFYPQRKIYVLYEPHRYSRLKDSWNDFLTCFDQADEIIISDVYSAGEEEILDYSLDRFINELKGQKTVRQMKLDQGFKTLYESIQSGGVLLCLGAGSISSKVRKLILEV